MPDRLEIFLHIQAGRLRALRALSNKIEKLKKVAALRKGPIFKSNSEINIRVFYFFFKYLQDFIYFISCKIEFHFIRILLNYLSTLIEYSKISTSERFYIIFKFRTKNFNFRAEKINAIRKSQKDPCFLSWVPLQALENSNLDEFSQTQYF